MPYKQHMLDELFNTLGEPVNPGDINPGDIIASRAAGYLAYDVAEATPDYIEAAAGELAEFRRIRSAAAPLPATPGSYIEAQGSGEKLAWLLADGWHFPVEGNGHPGDRLRRIFNTYPGSRVFVAPTAVKAAPIAAALADFDSEVEAITDLLSNVSGRRLRHISRRLHLELNRAGIDTTTGE